jgi:hypothetical protein
MVCGAVLLMSKQVWYILHPYLSFATIEEKIRSEVTNPEPTA